MVFTQNAKCEMQLSKTDDDMNMHNCGIARNCEMETVAVCCMTDGNSSYHGHVADIKNVAGEYQATLIVDRNSVSIAYNL